MSVLVTGGAGFIGAHLVHALSTAGDEVVVLDNLLRGDARKIAGLAGVRFVEGDIRDRETVAAAMRGVARVYHLAAQSNVLGAITDTDYSFGANVVGTYNVLVAARESGVERVIFSSSREVYGEVEALPVAEDRPANPKNTYGASKVSGEAYCQALGATDGLDVSILRLANVYGAGDRDRVIPIWLARAARGQPLELFGGEQVLDFVPISLVVAALLRAGERSLGGQPVNVGSGAGTRLRDLAARMQAMARDVGRAVEVQVRPARTAEVTRFAADVTRMRRLLGLEPPHDPLADLPMLFDLSVAEAGEP